MRGAHLTSQSVSFTNKPIHLLDWSPAARMNEFMKRGWRRVEPDLCRGGKAPRNWDEAARYGKRPYPWKSPAAGWLASSKLAEDVDQSLSSCGERAGSSSRFRWPASLQRGRHPPRTIASCSSSLIASTKKRLKWNLKSVRTFEVPGAQQVVVWTRLGWWRSPLIIRVLQKQKCLLASTRSSCKSSSPDLHQPHQLATHPQSITPTGLEPLAGPALRALGGASQCESTTCGRKSRAAGPPSSSSSAPGLDACALLAFHQEGRQVKEEA